MQTKTVEQPLLAFCKNYRSIRILSAVVLAMSGFAGPRPAHADSQFEIGPEYYYYQYREASFAKLDGKAFGLNGSYTYTWSQSLFLKLDATGDLGHLHYSSDGTGSENGVKDYTLDGRILVGANMGLAQAFSISPYLGLGYRMLYDNKGEAGTNPDANIAILYNRRSRYLYAPLGATFGIGIDDWAVLPNFEFDFLIQGFQTSYLSDEGVLNYGPNIIGANANVTNDQGSGYGLRGSIMIVPPIFNSMISFGPFARYWNIRNSNYFRDTIPNASSYAFYEPANSTLEAGIRANVRF